MFCDLLTHHPPKSLTATSPTESPRSHDSSKRPTISTKLWKHSPPQALVYRQEVSHLGVEALNEVNKESNGFEIQLPRWRNRVFVYPNMEEKTGYPVSLRLDRLGWKKNWQRRLGIKYTVLHVKGKKPVLPY